MLFWSALKSISLCSRWVLPSSPTHRRSCKFFSLFVFLKIHIHSHCYWMCGLECYPFLIDSCRADSTVSCSFPALRDRQLHEDLRTNHFKLPLSYNSQLSLTKTVYINKCIILMWDRARPNDFTKKFASQVTVLLCVVVVVLREIDLVSITQ